MRSLLVILIVVCSFQVMAVAQTETATVDLALPTDNDAIFHGGGPDFYQYVERDYRGEKSTPWEGGQYGFVRDPEQTRAGVVYTRFHEGIDIRCLHRDERGEPLDEVDRKSTRLNSSHITISYAVFCLKKKNNNIIQ